MCNFQDEIKCCEHVGCTSQDKVQQVQKGAENICHAIYQQVFNKEIDHLKDDNTGDRKSLRRRSGIYNLDPYIDEKDLLRVGEDSSLHLNDIRPVLLGKDGNIPRLIVDWCHKKVVHEACHK